MNGCGAYGAVAAPVRVVTAREARKIEADVIYSRDGTVYPLTITNYEMAEKFDPADFGAVVLDESSILKSIDGKTRRLLTEMFRETSCRLCCTATPSPNDIAEIANHSEFLGIMRRVDMLATFFVHDDAGWRLKKHAREPFYRWAGILGGSVFARRAILDIQADGFLLPPLSMETILIHSAACGPGELFSIAMCGIQDRSAKL